MTFKIGDVFKKIGNFVSGGGDDSSARLNKANEKKQKSIHTLAKMADTESAKLLTQAGGFKQIDGEAESSHQFKKGIFDKLYKGTQV